MNKKLYADRLSDLVLTIGVNLQKGEFLNEKIAPVPLSRFKNEPFVVLKQENDTRRRSSKICQAQGFSPKVVLELDQQMTSYNITCTCMGISFISDTLIRHVPPHPDVVYYKLPGEDTRRNLYFYWKNGKYVSRAMEEFLKIACQKENTGDNSPVLSRL